MKNTPMPNEADSSLKADFEALTDGIQRILDLGAQELADAEAKTEIVATLDPESEEYERLVQEVKAAQSRAGRAFQQAEELLAAANELLPQG